MAPSSSSTGTLTFDIAVPGRTASARPHRRMPAYVSASTAYVQITVQGQNETAPEAAQVFACTSVCTGSFSAPAGADRVALQLQDSAKKPLSSGIATVIVFAGQANTFAFTLDGVVASVDVQSTIAKLPVVPAASGYVLFNARDADGNIITYNGAHADASDAPFVFDLTSSDPNFVLSSTTVSGPGSVIPYAYKGTSHVGTITLSASLHPGTQTASTPTFTPATIALVPGIARQLQPPVPINILGAMQVPFASGNANVPSADIFVGNGSSGIALLTFNPTSGVYGGIPGGFSPGDAITPVVIAPPNASPGISGYVSTGDYFQGGGFRETFESYIFAQNMRNLTGVSTSDLCASGDVPIGPDPGTGFTAICSQVQFGSQPIDYTGNTAQTRVARGTVCKALVLGGNAYYVQTAEANSDEVWESNVAMPGVLLANATNFGLDVASANNFYLTYADGTVKLAGSTAAAATFSAPVTMTVANGSSIFVMEGQSFGYAKAGVVSESGPLPIGVPFELLASTNGTPYILEADGKIDVMAI